MGVLDAHVWTCHWFQPFQLYILTWDRPSWAGAYVGVQDSHIHMQGVNIRTPKDWCTCGRPGCPWVYLLLVPTIPTLHMDMGGVIMDWCMCGHPGIPCVDPSLPLNIPTLHRYMEGTIRDWCTCGRPGLKFECGVSEYIVSLGQVHMWASWNPITTRELEDLPPLGLCTCGDLGHISVRFYKNHCP